MQRDALMDGLAVSGERSDHAVGTDDAQLPDLVSAAVVANQQSEFSPRVGQGSVPGIGKRPRHGGLQVHRGT